MVEIKKIYLEPGVDLRDDLAAALKDALGVFTVWHGMETLAISAAEHRALLEALE
jgi:hypothetical protein